RRHTRFDCDWSSDVCSSDLTSAGVLGRARRHPMLLGALSALLPCGVLAAGAMLAASAGSAAAGAASMAGLAVANGVAIGITNLEIGRASCRERVEGSVVVVA